MPEAAFFTRFGLFAEEEFLDRAASARVVTEMRERGGRPATVSLSDEHVDDDYRRTTLADVSEETRTLVEGRIRAAMPTIGRHFDESLQQMERAQFLLYREGDHFRRHSDTPPGGQPSPDGTVRRVSLVLFLNGEGPADDADSYEGGQLTFYGLMGDLGLPLTGSPGLLVAFRSELVHAVTPVTRGERCTVVSWFR